MEDGGGVVEEWARVLVLLYNSLVPARHHLTTSALVPTSELRKKILKEEPEDAGSGATPRESALQSAE